MSKLLLASALVALSVADLEAELKNAYPLETINEALGMEAGKTDSRKTAIEALTDAAEEAAAKAEAEAAKNQTVIAPGKSLTSLKGILGEGTPVTPAHFPGGRETFDNLKKCGFIE